MSGIMQMIMTPLLPPVITEFTFTISSNVTNANLRTLAINAGWNQTSKVKATIASGVYVYSTSTATPGLTIDGSFPDGVELVNNGYIIGMGGKGGGNSGGPAISLGVSITITNNSYIAGGGGGGGNASNGAYGGGGAGGGLSGNNAGGGGPGASGNSGGASGGGGGRILPGSGGAGGASGGGGGAGGGGGSTETYFYPMMYYGYNAGGGGGWGAAGGLARNSGNYGQAGAGGSANNAGGSGGSGNAGQGGGAGGKAVNLNGYTVTWLVAGTRWGAIS